VLERWLEVKSATVEATTLASYRWIATNYLVPRYLPRSEWVETVVARRRREAIGMLLLGLAVVLGAGVWAGVRQILRPPRVPPRFEGPRPDPARQGYVSHTESTTIRVPREHYLRWVNSEEVDLSDLIQGSERLPRVVGTQVLRGSFELGDDRVSARRRVELSDGHFVAEEVLEDSPQRFRYMIWGFTSYQRLVIDHAVAEFLFEDRGEETKLTWTYLFHPRSPFLRQLVARFVNGVWVGLMRNALEGMRTGAEASLASSRR
jgi:hypothetical protein